MDGGRDGGWREKDPRTYKNVNEYYTPRSNLALVDKNIVV